MPTLSPRLPREAIQVLTAKGLVESRPKAGTRVLPRNRWNLLDPDVLAWAFAGEPDIQFVRDLFELRAIVEPAAIVTLEGPVTPLYEVVPMVIRS